MDISQARAGRLVDEQRVRRSAIGERVAREQAKRIRLVMDAKPVVPRDRGGASEQERRQAAAVAKRLRKARR